MSSSIGADVLTFLAKLPPEALPATGRMLSAVLAGDPAKAEREARIAAQTVGIKRAARAGAKAASKALKR